MHKQFLATTVLAVALLLSQGGNFLIACLCPHLRSAPTSCETQVAQPTVSHQHADHMQMESMEAESTSEQRADGNSFGPPNEQCMHCSVHSRSAPDASPLREAEAAKRPGHLTLPLIVSRGVSVPTSFVPILAAMAHGPPGDPTPRYILINIFRI
jgi:hypothetical protein